MRKQIHVYTLRFSTGSNGEEEIHKVCFRVGCSEVEYTSRRPHLLLVAPGLESTFSRMHPSPYFSFNSVLLTSEFRWNPLHPTLVLSMLVVICSI